MITAIRFRRRRADLLSHWSSTGCGDTHSNAPSQRQSEPAMATLDGYLNHQHLLLLPKKARHCSPSSAFRSSDAPSASPKDAMRRTKARRSLFAHSFVVHHHVEETANGS